MIGNSHNHLMTGGALDNLSRDTADLYSNHKQLATSLAVSLPKLGLTREDLFLTTKIRPTDLGYLQCKFAVRRFLEELSTFYLDLVLIHDPHVPPILGMAPSRSDQKTLRLETWKCLEEFNKEGVIKSIGVSNYDEEQIQEILDLNGLVPQVNQVYKTPFQDQVCPSYSNNFYIYLFLRRNFRNLVENIKYIYKLTVLLEVLAEIEYLEITSSTKLLKSKIRTKTFLYSQ